LSSGRMGTPTSVRRTPQVSRGEGPAPHARGGRSKALQRWAIVRIYYSAKQSLFRVIHSHCPPLESDGAPLECFATSSPFMRCGALCHLSSQTLFEREGGPPPPERLLGGPLGISRGFWPGPWNITHSTCIRPESSSLFRGPFLLFPGSSRTVASESAYRYCQLVS
jgi:hypothetical protein